MRPVPTSRFEEVASARGYSVVVGIDEAGRGPLAGPVVAAAVVWSPRLSTIGVMDSKVLSPREREGLLSQMEGQLIFAVGLADNQEIDRLNILNATLLAMERAIAKLPREPSFLLIDGPHTLGVDIPQQAIPRGDCLSVTIAAASIVAKVTRDRLMDQIHRAFPGYNFIRNKGYPTPEHLEALKRLGHCPYHRLSFGGVRETPACNGY